jgi:hypothetical protein
MSNKVNLDLNKLVNFCNVTYNNTEKNLLSNIVSTVPNMHPIAHNNLINPTIIKNINTCKIGNIIDDINKIKSNLLLNEKGIHNKYTFFDLSTVIYQLGMNNKDDICNTGNELVLIYPYSFNDTTNNEKWYSLLNSLLIILHDTYTNELMTTKKEIINTTSELYKKKINNFDNFKHVIQTVGNISNVNIIVLDSITDCTVYNNSQNNNSQNNNSQNNKYIVLINILENYYPVFNFDHKYYTNKSLFITHLLSIGTKYDSHKAVDNTQFYEVATNEDFSLYISEVGPNKKEVIKKEDSDKKKKKKKNIFIKDDEDKDKANDKTNNSISKHGIDKDDDVVFNKVEPINYVELKKMFKSSSKLDEIQAIALKLNISIISGSTKDGKPKNRVKNDIVNDITNLFNNIIT